VNRESNFGLQWLLALICLAAGTAGSLAALATFWAACRYGLTESSAYGSGALAGLLVGLTAAVISSLITRLVKLRLWEAGRMAGRIARGDYGARLQVGSDNEVGWLEEQLNQMAAQLETAVASLNRLAEQNRLLGEEAGRGAALEERMKLARDLHDTVNQQLFVLTMRAAAVKRRLNQPAVELSPVLAEIESLEEMARQAHTQIRELILQLRPVTLEKEGLGAALKDYLKSAADREGWQIYDSIDCDVSPDRIVGESFFRIAQEALNNISKHAEATVVDITLAVNEQSLVMSITDNGGGFDSGSVICPTRVGLVGIKERAASVGGKADIISSPGQGTKIKIEVPLNREGGDVVD
jgi:two-component system, NarL family, sensor histidine kinase LiaS